MRYAAIYTWQPKVPGGWRFYKIRNSTDLWYLRNIILPRVEERKV